MVAIKHKLKYSVTVLDNNNEITRLRLLTCKYVGDGAASESYCDINIQRKGFPLRPVEADPRPLADLRGGTIKKGTIGPPTYILIVMELDYTRAIRM